MTVRSISVSSQQELQSALAQATGGETILLAPGDYGRLVLGSGDFPTVASTVTIRSASSADPAVFSGLSLNNMSNLAIEGVTFDYSFAAGDPLFARPFTVSGSTNIAIRNSTFDGDKASGVSEVADGYATGIGLSVRSSSGVAIEGNEFRDFHRGLVLGNSSDLVIRGNDVHSMRSDGMNFSQVQGVLIEGNYLHDFRASLASSDHRDMIQFWTTATTAPNTDIVIRDNYLDVGQGDSTQSIFMRNEEVDSGRAGAEMFYRNVLIENNTIMNGHLHGITIGATSGLAIRNNSVLHADGNLVDGADDSVEIPTISVASISADVLIEGNISGGIRSETDYATWVARNNLTAQDQNPLAPGWYGDLFVSSTLDSSADWRFIALPDGTIMQSSLGSSVTRDVGTGLLPMFQLAAPEAATRIFDASVSLLEGASLPDGTRFHWTFGDGTTADGIKVSHSYAAGGTYAATLTITLPDGTVASERLDVQVQATDLVRMEPSGFVATESGADLALGAVAGMTSEGLQLGADGVTAQVARKHVVDVVGSDDMTVAFTLDADQPGAAGELFRLHGSFIAAVNTNGELVFNVMRDGQSMVTVTTVGAGLNAVADDPHDIVVDLDDGSLGIWVDGVLRAQATDVGSIGGLGSSAHHLVFGNPWGRTNFDGDLRAFSLSEDDGSFVGAPATTVLVPETPGADQSSASLAAFGAAFGDILPAWSDSTEERFEFGSGVSTAGVAL